MSREMAESGSPWDFWKLACGQQKQMGWKLLWGGARCGLPPQGENQATGFPLPRACLVALACSLFSLGLGFPLCIMVWFGDPLLKCSLTSWFYCFLTGELVFSQQLVLPCRRDLGCYASMGGHLCEEDLLEGS